MNTITIKVEGYVKPEATYQETKITVPFYFRFGTMNYKLIDANTCIGVSDDLDELRTHTESHMAWLLGRGGLKNPIEADRFEALLNAMVDRINKLSTL